MSKQNSNVIKVDIKLEPSRDNPDEWAFAISVGDPHLATGSGGSFEHKLKIALRVAESGALEQLSEE